jgi:Flp pilus assembly protein TadD
MRGVGRTEAMVGRWEEALTHFRQAERLDPRGVSNKSAVGDALQRLRRTTEARESFERLLTMAPNNLNAIEALVMTYLQEGDLPGARNAIGRWAKGVDPDELVAYFATFYDLMWMFDAEQAARLRRLTPRFFDDNPAAWAIAQAQASYLAGDAPGTRAHAEEALKSFDQQLASLPNEPALHAPRALALAYLGRNAEALREGERAVVLGGPEKDAQGGNLLPASAGARRDPDRRAREGARPRRAAFEDPVLPFAGRAEDRSELRSASEESTLREAPGWCEVTLASGTKLGSYEIVAHSARAGWERSTARATGS